MIKMEELVIKKLAKFEANKRFKIRLYNIYNNDDKFKYNGTQASYISLNKNENFTKKNFYHIICDPDLGLGYCYIRCTPRAFDKCGENYHINVYQM